MINKIKPAPSARSEVAVSIHSDFESFILYYKSLWSLSRQRGLDALRAQLDTGGLAQEAKYFKQFSVILFVQLVQVKVKAS